MTNRLDYSNAVKASEVVGHELFKRFLNARAFLNGSDIISFTDVPAINYLVIREIFIKWNSEISNLQSPYFNYSHLEVKKALNDFLNVLSNHILVKSETLEALLKKSTLCFIAIQTNPLILFHAFYPNQEKVSTKELESDLKFVKTNKVVFDGLIQSFKSHSHDSFTIADAEALLARVLEDHKAEINLNQDYLDRYGSFPLMEFKGELSDENLPFSDPILKKESSAVGVETPTLQRAPQLTLNDTLRQTDEDALINKLSKAKIESIKNEISLIKKFMFINELFKENNIDYNIALTIADGAGSFPSAKKQLFEEFSEKYEWKEDSEALKEFLQIVERRY